MNSIKKLDIIKTVNKFKQWGTTMAEYNFSDIKVMTVDELLSVLRDGTPSNKEDAANILGALKSMRSINALEEMIKKEKDYYVREAGRRALATIHSVEYVAEPKTADHIREGNVDKDEVRDDKVDPTEGKDYSKKPEEFKKDPRFHEDNLD